MLEFCNEVKLEIVRNGIIVDEDHTHNAITDGGKSLVLGAVFNQDSSQINKFWYLGLIATNESLTPYLGTSDTMGSKSWTEFIDYDEDDRPRWFSEGTGLIMSNPIPATFTVNKAGFLHGMFVVNENNKDGNTGVLWATAAFNKRKPVDVGDLVKLVYIMKV